MSFYAYVKQPDNDDSIWHYLDFAQFVLLLDQHALFFEQAISQDSLFEGFGTIGNTIPGGTSTHTPQPDNPDRTTLCRASLVISCWYRHEHELAAMWKQHAGAVVAVQSTVQRLKRGLNYSLLKYVKLGAVNYEPPVISDDDAGVSIEVDYFYKRQSFAHEQEIRVLAHARDLDLVTRYRGLQVPVDLDTVIAGIHISPRAAPWLADLVRGLVQDTYHLEAGVAQADLHAAAS